MKISITACICMLLATLPVFSQNIPDLEGPTSVPLHLVGPYGAYYEQGDKKVIGNPFLFEGEWVTGKILKPSGHFTGQLKFRYNKLRQELEVKVENNGQKQAQLVPAKNINGFTITEEPIMVFRNGFGSNERGVNRNTLMQVIYDGKTKLLKYHKSKLIEGRQPDYRTGIVTDKFVNNEEYYLLGKSEKLISVKLKKRSILKHLPGHAGQLEKYADQNDLGFKNESDLVLLLKHFDDQLL